MENPLAALGFGVGFCTLFCEEISYPQKITDSFSNQKQGWLGCWSVYLEVYTALPFFLEMMVSSTVRTPTFLNPISIWTIFLYDLKNNSIFFLTRFALLFPFPKN